MSGSAAGMLAIWPLLVFLIYLVLLVLGVYCLILFIQLAKRAIKALDLYIQEKSNQD
ncbi:Uncharacterised protein [Chlamydia abortus]|jgi:hypothetical protein|uniref:Uncharacterized protein n=1 Tax=Paenibacillus residui TaxID=629724 RepID=A0ABW3DHB4_9BACL|nr:hypothetical protein [Paenibacillus sp. 32O-W]SHE15226.1 Uncharacterised protein [Chlamydia abortus]